MQRRLRPSSLKTCTKCHIARDRTGFSTGRAECKACHSAYLKSYLGRPGVAEERSAYSKRHKKQNPGYYRAYYAKNKHRHFGYMIKSKYGITLDEYNAMFSAQGGCCLICRSPQKPGKRLYIDHNHTTGQVRGLLCQPCNSLVGFCFESVDVLSSAIEYLSRANFITKGDIANSQQTTI